MNFKLFFLIGLYLAILSSGCFAQNDLTITKEVFSKVDSITLYKLTIKNNYSDSIVLIPLALKYNLGEDTLYDIDFDINHEGKIQSYYISIDKYTIGNLVKYYRLESKGSISFFISLQNQCKNYRSQLIISYYKFTMKQINTTESYIMHKPSNSNLEEVIVVLN